MGNKKEIELAISENSEKVIRTKITLMSFFASVFVIYIHAFNLEQYGITSEMEGFAHFVYFTEYFLKNIIDIAVPTFFMISGLLFFRNFKIQNIWHKWRTRAYSVLIPYVLWSAIYYLFFLACANIPAISRVMNNEWSPIFSIKALLSSFWSGNYYTFWFLKKLMIYILMTPIIWLLVNNHFEKVHTGTIAYVLLFVIVSYYESRISYSGGFVFFLTGAYIGLNHKRFIAKRSKVLSIISLAFIIFVILTGDRFQKNYTIVLSVVAVWFLLDFVNFSRCKVYWWMSITFFTYITHDIVLQVIKKIVFLLLPHNSVIALLAYIVIPLAVEMFLMGAAYFLRKYLPHTWKMLTGGR